MRITQLLIGLTNLIIGVVVSVLGLRFVLRLFAANPDNGFVSWVYNSSAEIMNPFRGIFPTTSIGSGSVIDFSVLFAILAYGLFGLLVVYAIGVLDSPKNS